MSQNLDSFFLTSSKDKKKKKKGFSSTTNHSQSQSREQLLLSALPATTPTLLSPHSFSVWTVVCEKQTEYAVPGDAKRRRAAEQADGTVWWGWRREGDDSEKTLFTLETTVSFFLAPFQSFCLSHGQRPITLTSENDSVYTAYCHFYWTKRTVFTRKTTLSAAHRPIRC